MGASVAPSGTERRRSQRVRIAETAWHPVALLRPGREVEVLDVSQGGARVRCRFRLFPGRHTEVQLIGATSRRTLPGRVDRCWVCGLDPLIYEGVIVFHEPLDIVRA